MKLFEAAFLEAFLNFKLSAFSIFIQKIQLQGSREQTCQGDGMLGASRNVRKSQMHSRLRRFRVACPSRQQFESCF